MHRLSNFMKRLDFVLAIPARLASWLILPIIVLVVISVGASLLRLSSLVTWEGEVFLLGSGVSLNTLLELQWHLFALMTMLVGSYALVTDQHIRVDALSSHFSARTRLVIDIIGDTILLIPFCWLMTKSAWPLVQLAIATGERSAEDGLTDRWLVKMIIPFGFALLGTLAFSRMVRNLIKLCRRDEASLTQLPEVTDHGR